MEGGGCCSTAAEESVAGEKGQAKMAGIRDVGGKVGGWVDERQADMES